MDMDVDGVAPPPPTLGSLEELRFDNLQLRALPLDTERNQRTTQRQVAGACFSLAHPTPIDRPWLVAVAPEVLALLGVRTKEAARPDFADFFSGNRVLPGAEPAAHCYCGFQFGHFSGQLGDGATMYLGEVLNSRGERWELQFKGAGKTPYSRTADGRKVLRSSLREFLCSEANHALGVPTTRAAACVSSETRIVRDIFYDGNPSHERATVVTRVAPSFLRFGSFEITRAEDPITGRAGPSAGQHELLERLLDHSAALLCPEHVPPGGGGGGDGNGAAAIAALSPLARKSRWAAAYRQMVVRNARLAAHWQCVGFCHGVLNTDNMSILGLTIDYGPFGFLETYDGDFACNGSDEGGRYTYAQQPKICEWNCATLAASLAPVLPRAATDGALAEFWPTYRREHLRLMRAKLGLCHPPPAALAAATAAATDASASSSSSSLLPPEAKAAAPMSAEDEADDALVERLRATMQATGADFTHTFRMLSQHVPALCAAAAAAAAAAAPPAAPDALVGALLERCASQQEVAAAMRKRASGMGSRIPPPQLQQLLMLAQVDPEKLAMFGNPAAVIAELQQEWAKVEKAAELRKAADAAERAPPAEKRRRDEAAWRGWLGEYAERLIRDVAAAAAVAGGASVEEEAEARRGSMLRANPRVVLRNWIAQEAIEAAENQDVAAVERVMHALLRPYDDADDHYAGKAPDWAAGICVT